MSAAEGGWLSRLARGLAKTRDVLSRPVEALRALATAAGPDREAALRDLEAALVGADVGVALAARLTAEARAAAPGADIGQALRRRLLEVLAAAHPPAAATGADDGPHVTFLVGVNGTGKTTTAGKLAARLAAAGQRPVLAACDTFRAAAVEQVAEWARRAEVPLVRQRSGADPAAVMHDALTRARERGESPVIVDTAGRLHVKGHLMQELARMARVAGRVVPGAPHDSWLVIDATTGQNGLVQAREFAAAVPLTGTVLTKLDGTARGGIALAIADELRLPIRYVGVGESLEDLLPMDPEAFVDGLLGLPATAQAP